MFNSKNFSVMAYANGFTMLNYTTTDSLATVKAANYFNSASSFVKKGDMVLLNADTDATLSSAILSISGNADSVVSVSQIAPYIAQ